MPKFETNAAFTVTVRTVIDAATADEALSKLDEMLENGTIKLELVLDTSVGGFVIQNAGEGVMDLAGINHDACDVFRLPDFTPMEIPTLRELYEAERRNLDIGRD